MNKTLRRILCAGAVITGTTLFFLPDAKLERTRRDVQLLIDTDSNRVITREEWAPVYRELGVNDSLSYGLDLTTSQLKQYLENHRGGAR